MMFLDPNYVQAQKTESNQPKQKKVKTVKGPIKYTKDHHSKFDTRVVNCDLFLMSFYFFGSQSHKHYNR